MECKLCKYDDFNRPYANEKIRPIKFYGNDGEVEPSFDFKMPEEIPPKIYACPSCKGVFYK